jgi:hypothetical protein
MSAIVGMRYRNAVSGEGMKLWHREAYGDANRTGTSGLAAAPCLDSETLGTGFLAVCT